jgi:hypothetical protein
LQQLILQAENDYSYSIVLNEGGAGKLSFGVNVTTDGTTIIQADDRNYADGNWYYFAARYNDSDDTISLDVLSADGSLENNEISLTSGAELVTGGDGNMFIGRETYQGGRQFYGLINEIRISSGVLDNSELMGDLPLESEPYPSPRADNIELNPRLSWKHNPDAVAYNVYFGQDEPLDYVGRLEHNYYEPDQLNPGDTYLWRIDEITEGDTVNTGKLWYFTTKAPNCDGPIPNDYNKDCAVNFKDLKHFVRYWLHCGIVPQSACFD